MPFAARRRHQFWSADVRYVDNGRVGQGLRDLRAGQPLPRGPLQRRDAHPGPRLLPLGFVRGGGAPRLTGGARDRRRWRFRANQARAVYEALGIAKHEIERGRPWQNQLAGPLRFARSQAVPLYQIGACLQLHRETSVVPIELPFGAHALRLSLTSAVHPASGSGSSRNGVTVGARAGEDPTS